MRYLPLTDGDRQAMLGRIGAASIDDLFVDVPEAARRDGLVDLPRHQGEMQVERQLSAMAGKNITAGSVPFFCGAGAYKHHVPATVDHIIQRSEFLTSYTPYQPEITQGTLQYLFEFQTQVSELTGMPVANASMYDGSTSTAEAVLMAHRVTRKSRAVLSGRLHPHYTAVVENISDMGGFAVAQADITPTGEEDLLALIDDDTSCVVVQNPDFFGNVVDFTALAKAVQDKGCLLIAVVPEIVSLGLLKRPGDMGADIVAGEGQSIGNGLNFGGPYVGLFAARDKHIRQMPGRLCGETVDADGKRGFVLTLSTREQHIRRDKATSNICTNSGLCSLAFTAHMTLLGGKGFRHLAQLNHARAVQTANALGAIDGVEVLTGSFFNEFAVKLPRPAAEIAEALADKGVLGGVPVSRLAPQAGLDDVLLVAATEATSEDDIAALAAAMKEVLA
ncbi:MAG: aminomethyl-transferring glycine dehydrogenase subunit GcvPA [Parvibaculales bacterium]